MTTLLPKVAVFWGIANDEADGRHGAQPFPMMRIMVMTAPFDQRAEIQTETLPSSGNILPKAVVIVFKNEPVADDGHGDYPCGSWG